MNTPNKKRRGARGGDVKKPHANRPNHLCRVPGCGKTIPIHRFLCQKHWRQVPSTIKGKVFDAREQYVKDKTTHRVLRAAEAEATDAVVAAEGGVA